MTNGGCPWSLAGFEGKQEMSQRQRQRRQKTSGCQRRQHRPKERSSVLQGKDRGLKRRKAHRLPHAVASGWWAWIGCSSARAAEDTRTLAVEQAWVEVSRVVAGAERR